MRQGYRLVSAGAVVAGGLSLLAVFGPARSSGPAHPIAPPRPHAVSTTGRTGRGEVPLARAVKEDANLRHLPAGGQVYVVNGVWAVEFASRPPASVMQELGRLGAGFSYGSGGKPGHVNPFSTTLMVPSASVPPAMEPGRAASGGANVLMSRQDTFR